jgi:DNA-binding Lrp family transcriptional regulator
MENNILDAASRRLLRELQRDSRQTVQELSTKVGLSASPCWRRVKDLETAGVVRRYTALVAREKVGLSTCILAQVSLARQTENAAAEFEAAMQACPEVIECHSLTGDADYVVKVVVPDIKAYDAFLRRVMYKIQAIGTIRSNVVLREVKYETALPV